MRCRAEGHSAKPTPSHHAGGCAVPPLCIQNRDRAPFGTRPLGKGLSVHAPFRESGLSRMSAHVLRAPSGAGRGIVSVAPHRTGAVLNAPLEVLKDHVRGPTSLRVCNDLSIFSHPPALPVGSGVAVAEGVPASYPAPIDIDRARAMPQHVCRDRGFGTGLTQNVNRFHDPVTAQGSRMRPLLQGRNRWHVSRPNRTRWCTHPTQPKQNPSGEHGHRRWGSTPDPFRSRSHHDP